MGKHTKEKINNSLFDNLDDVFISEYMILADLLRVIFNRWTPNQSTDKEARQGIKISFIYKMTLGGT